MSNPFQETSAGGLMSADGTTQYSLPKYVKYSNVMPVGLPASSQTMAMGPNNGAKYAPGINSTIKIPITANSFLSPSESYLRFTVSNNSANAWKVQGSAYSFFTAIRLDISDNGAIDQVERFGPLAALLSDCQLPLTYRQSMGNISMGYAGKALVGSKLTANDIIAVEEDLQSGTAEIPAGGSRIFTIPIPVGLLAQDKYIPLQKIKGAGLQLTLTVAPYNEAAFGPGACLYEMTNVAYVAKLVNFDGAFMSAFDSVMANGGIEIACPTYHHQGSNAAENQGYNINIAARARSVKSVFVVQRETNILADNNTQINRTDSRSLAELISYQFKIGQVNYPQEAISVETHGSVPYIELFKAMGSQLNPLTSGSIINASNYVDDQWVAAIAQTATVLSIPRRIGKFAYGYDFESFGANSGLENGVNTANNNLSFSLDAKRDLGGSPAIEIDIYVLIDQFISINFDGSLRVTR